MRLLDLGTVPYLDSQTIYHAVAHTMQDGDAGTVSLMRPDRPYICIGCHQELDREVDTGYCRERGMPVLRREVGGGAVYLDGNQMFVHLIAPKSRMPRQVQDVYRLFIEPLVETYRAFGVEASYRPLNDIVVGSRKIGGTGIAAMGEAMVVAGSVMFDFDTQTMARCLKVSSEKMRDKIHQSLDEYMTTLRRELPCPPTVAEVKPVLVRSISKSLGVELWPGALTAFEREKVGELNRRFESEGWLRQKGGLARKGVLIRAGVRVVEADHKAPGGLIRVTARVNEDVIEDLTISGDFTFHPVEALGELESALRGLVLRFDQLERRAGDVMAEMGVQSPGVTAADFARALMLVSDAENDA